MGYIHVYTWISTLISHPTRFPHSTQLVKVISSVKDITIPELMMLFKKYKTVTQTRRTEVEKKAESVKA